MLAKLRGKNRNHKDDNRLSKLRMSISAPTGFKHANHMDTTPNTDVGSKPLPAEIAQRDANAATRTAEIGRVAVSVAGSGVVAAVPERPPMTTQQKQKLRESISGPMTLANKPVPVPRVGLSAGLAAIEQVTEADLPPPSIGDLAESQAAEAVVAIAAAKQAEVPTDALLVQGYLSIARATGTNAEGVEWDQHWFKLVKNWRCVIGYSDPSCSVVTSSIPLEGFIHARFGQEIGGREDEHTLAIQTALGTRLVLCPTVHKASTWLQSVTTVGLIVQELPPITRPVYLPPPPPPCLEAVPMLEDSFADDDLFSGSAKRLSTNLASTGCEPLTTFPEEDDGEELDEFEALCISQGLLTER